MIDIIYDAIMSSNAFTDDQKKDKWGILLDGVLTTDAQNNSILTAAALRDLADLDATKERATVVCDLKSISNRLASAHHKGASDLSGMGWRLGVQPSPSLAAALIVIKNLRMLDKRQICLPLKEPVAFLNLRADVSHELNFDRLCWGAKLPPPRAARARSRAASSEQELGSEPRRASRDAALEHTRPAQGTPKPRRVSPLAAPLG